MSDTRIKVSLMYEDAVNSLFPKFEDIMVREKIELDDMYRIVYEACDGDVAEMFRDYMEDDL